MENQWDYYGAAFKTEGLPGSCGWISNCLLPPKHTPQFDISHVSQELLPIMTQLTEVIGFMVVRGSPFLSCTSSIKASLELSLWFGCWGPGSKQMECFLEYLTFLAATSPQDSRWKQERSQKLDSEDLCTKSIGRTDVWPRKFVHSSVTISASHLSSVLFTVPFYTYQYTIGNPLCYGFFLQITIHCFGNALLTRFIKCDTVYTICHSMIISLFHCSLIDKLLNWIILWLLLQIVVGRFLILTLHCFLKLTAWLHWKITFLKSRIRKVNLTFILQAILISALVRDNWVLISVSAFNLLSILLKYITYIYYCYKNMYASMHIYDIYYSNFFFLNGVILCSPGWPGTCYIDQDGLRLMIILQSAFQVLKLQACITILVFVDFFEIGSYYMALCGCNSTA